VSSLVSVVSLGSVVDGDVVIVVALVVAIVVDGSDPEGDVVDGIVALIPVVSAASVDASSAPGSPHPTETRIDRAQGSLTEVMTPR
jgi:hypothetical protein